MASMHDSFLPFPGVAGFSMSDADSPEGVWPARHAFPADVLLVEDNYIIALDTEDLLHQLGVTSVRTASTVPQALKLIAATPPGFALLDVNLGNEKCFAVAEHLLTLGIPFAFATGYGDKLDFPTKFSDARIVQKPYTLDALRWAISRLG